MKSIKNSSVYHLLYMVVDNGLDFLCIGYFIHFKFASSRILGVSRQEFSLSLRIPAKITAYADLNRHKQTGLIIIFCP
jgi:hypothetical protein